MALLEELFEGSYNGAKFLIESATTKGGRKQVKHEYPNSDKQKIEDLGLQPRNFKISAIISGENYLQRRDKLLAELSKGGEGTLSHPFFSGSFKVTPRPWSINETTKQLGRATISLEFDISDRFTSPTKEPTSVQEIQAKVGIASELLESFISGTEFVPPAIEVKNPADSISLQNVLGGFTNFTNTVVDSVFAAVSEINSYKAAIDDFENNIARLAQLPTELADSLISIISTVDSLFQSFDSAIESYKKFFGFGDDIKSQQPPPNTVARARRASNANIIVDTTQAAYLVVAYQRAAIQEYTTVNEVEEVQQLLEQQYLRVRDYELSEETLDIIATLRALVQSWLEGQRINAAQVIDVETKQLPLSVIAYQYYGDVEEFNDLVDVLVDLNRPKSNNLSYMEGAIKVLTV